MEVLLENVRCFCDYQEISLRPLTLLVGENSSGKTTFLAMLNHVSRRDFPLTRPSFNEEPFDLGPFDSIATFKGGRYGRADTFSVGHGFQEEQHRKVLVTYKSYKGQPIVSKLLVTGESFRIFLEIGEQNESAEIQMDYKERRHRFSVDVKEVMERGAPLNYFLAPTLSQYFQTLKPEESAEASRLMYQYLPPFRGNVPPVFALAPVRTKPRRTYDEISDEFRPEGQHVPIQLARLWQEENDSERAHLANALSEFGKSATLFKKIGVRRLGPKPSDPFQILVTTEGPPVNLLDVGYGVSQALPLIVESVLATKGRRLLLQQPEVHLHPRGQAALGSFFAHLVSKERKQFVIETHSDYILDRIRTEVGQGNLNPEDLSILFFEKRGMVTHIHAIGVDQDGNVVGAPDSYRQFFLDEELRLMRRAAK